MNHVIDNVASFYQRTIQHDPGSNFRGLKLSSWPMKGIDGLSFNQRFVGTHCRSQNQTCIKNLFFHLSFNVVLNFFLGSFYFVLLLTVKWLQIKHPFTQWKASLNPSHHLVAFSIFPCGYVCLGCHQDVSPLPL